MTVSNRKRSSDFDGITLESDPRLDRSGGRRQFLRGGARRIGRAQSAVSQAMGILESFVGFKIWDRSERT